MRRNLTGHADSEFDPQATPNTAGKCDATLLVPASQKCGSASDSELGSSKLLQSCAPVFSQMSAVQLNVPSKTPEQHEFPTKVPTSTQESQQNRCASFLGQPQTSVSRCRSKQKTSIMHPASTTLGCSAATWLSKFSYISSIATETSARSFAR